jgi:hypothetical protein
MKNSHSRTVSLAYNKKLVQAVKDKQAKYLEKQKLNSDNNNLKGK